MDNKVIIRFKEDFPWMAKLICEEVNVHEFIWGRWYFWTSLGFTDKPDRIWIDL